jgi:hypothetical protein
VEPWRTARTVWRCLQGLFRLKLHVCCGCCGLAELGVGDDVGGRRQRTCELESMYARGGVKQHRVGYGGSGRTLSLRHDSKPAQKLQHGGIRPAAPTTYWQLQKIRWCPSIACMKGRQGDAGRWLIESVDASQMALGNRQSLEQTGSCGTTMPARSRSTPTFWPVRRRELPSTKARLAMVSFAFAARTSYLE